MFEEEIEELGPSKVTFTSNGTLKLGLNIAFKVMMKEDDDWIEKLVIFLRIETNF
jgi:hypothetical protein